MNGCLNGFIKILVASFFILLIYYTITDNTKTVSVPVTTQKYPTVDPNREVDHFDWQTMQYVYKDEVPQVKESRPRQIIYLKEVTTNNKSPWDGKQVVIDGKRYRVNERPNGDLQFIRIR